MRKRHFTQQFGIWDALFASRPESRHLAKFTTSCKAAGERAKNSFSGYVRSTTEEGQIMTNTQADTRGEVPLKPVTVKNTTF